MSFLSERQQKTERIPDPVISDMGNGRSRVYFPELSTQQMRRVGIVDRLKIVFCTEAPDAFFFCPNGHKRMYVLKDEETKDNIKGKGHCFDCGAALE